MAELKPAKEQVNLLASTVLAYLNISAESAGVALKERLDGFNTHFDK